MAILKGFDAIEYKKQNPGVELHKYNDPTEERFDISVEFAEEVASEDPGLIWVDTDV